jgi:uncharacterized protein (DUF362 family)
MKRRTFIGLAGGAAVVALGGAGLVRSCGLPSSDSVLPPSAVKPIHELAGTRPKTAVGLAGVHSTSREPDIASGVRAAAEAATDFSWLSRGDTVFIKPVVNSGNLYPATTSPDAIAAMIRLLKDKGAGRVMVGDMSGIEHVKLTPDKMKGSSRELAVSCGIVAAVERTGGELYFPEEEGWGAFYEEGPAVQDHWKNGIMMPKILKQVDHVVLMPRCSRHILAGATLGLKAVVGYWRTDSRLEYHRDAATLQEKTADANTVPTLQEKQRLVLTVADRVLTTFGPDKGYVVTPPTGLIIASESIMAHDMVSLAWLLENRLITPAENMQGRHDPYTSQLMVAWANRVVTFLLGGVAEAMRTEILVRNDVSSIWDDRVLRRGFEVFGGIPDLHLKVANAMLPSPTRDKLAAATRLL